MNHWIVNDLSQLPVACTQICDRIGGNPIVAFIGEMGSGKTTFIKGLCRALGVVDRVSSPTFALVNEYALPSGEPVYHFDFYRINSLKEALDIGVEEYFDSHAYCFIEWPERIKPLLPPETVWIKIELLPNGGRGVKFFENLLS